MLDSYSLENPGDIYHTSILNSSVMLDVYCLGNLKHLKQLQIESNCCSKDGIFIHKYAAVYTAIAANT